MYGLENQEIKGIDKSLRKGVSDAMKKWKQ